MVKYWEQGGVKDDYWIPCDNTEREWFEFNCTYLPNIGQLFCVNSLVSSNRRHGNLGALQLCLQSGL